MVAANFNYSLKRSGSMVLEVKELKWPLCAGQP